MNPKIPILHDDGLYTPTVGSWALRKYKLLEYYAQLFASSMSRKWDCRVYLDLFSGPGRGRLKGTRQVIPTSPSLALAVSDPFNKYVFCDINPCCISTLSNRVSRDYPLTSASYINGDCNQCVPKILAAIPTPSKGFTVLTFCFVDPFALQNLSFQTIAQLSALYVDFLVLIPAYMDARRNFNTYLRPTSCIVETFLGVPDWRSRWNSSQAPAYNFGTFIADQFGQQMRTLQYHYSGLGDTVLVKYPQKNIPLYRLAFFSRHSLGHRFWKEAMRYTQQQLPLFAI